MDSNPCPNTSPKPRHPVPHPGMETPPPPRAHLGRILHVCPPFPTPCKPLRCACSAQGSSRLSWGRLRFVPVRKGCLFPRHAAPALFQGLSNQLGTFHAAPRVPWCIYSHILGGSGKGGSAFPGSRGFRDLQDSAGRAPALNGLFVPGCSSCELSSSGLC